MRFYGYLCSFGKGAQFRATYVGNTIFNTSNGASQQAIVKWQQCLAVAYGLVSGIAFEFTDPSRGVVSALPLVLGVLIEALRSRSLLRVATLVPLKRPNRA